MWSLRRRVTIELLVIAVLGLGFLTTVVVAIVYGKDDSKLGYQGARADREDTLFKRLVGERLDPLVAWG